MDHPFVRVEGQEVLGEVVTWSSMGISISHTDLVNALKDADLDDAVARKLAPRHAFSRACNKLSTQRIIRQVADDGEVIRFQFTREKKEDDRFNYDFEAVLSLNKITGAVTCESAGLAELAQAELDKAIGMRTGSDVTRITQKLFEQSGIELFPIREQGAAYFVAQTNIEFVERINKFLDVVNASMKRLPISKGTPQGDRAVRESVANGMNSAIRDLDKLVDNLQPDMRASTFAARGEEIKECRYKLECYSDYLGDLKLQAENALAEVSLKLRKKIEEIATEATAVA